MGMVFVFLKGHGLLRHHWTFPLCIVIVFFNIGHECAMVWGFQADMEDCLDKARHQLKHDFSMSCWILFWLTVGSVHDHGCTKWALATNFLCGKHLLAQPLCSSQNGTPTSISFRDVALSYVHGVYAHWQIDLILHRIRSFLGPADLQMMLCKLQEPCPVESNAEPGTMERTWSSAPSTPRRFRLSRCLQVAGIGQSTQSPRNSDDLLFDDIPVDGNWTMMVYEHGRTTPTFGYGFHQMLQWWRWMSWCYVNGLCYRSLFTAVWFANLPPDSEGPMFFCHAKWQWRTRNLEHSCRGKPAPAAMTGTSLTATAACTIMVWISGLVWTCFLMQVHGAMWPLFLVQRPLFPVQCPLLCSMSTVCIVLNTNNEQWTLNSFFMHPTVFPSSKFKSLLYVMLYIDCLCQYDFI